VSIAIKLNNLKKNNPDEEVQVIVIQVMSVFRNAPVVFGRRWHGTEEWPS